jgi:hypothetical protein
MKNALVFSLLMLASFNTHAAELFEKGRETFQIQNQKGQTPTFRVLQSSMTKQALAMAAIGLLNAQDEVQPKLPMTQYVDLKFQTLTLVPEGKDTLRMKLKLTGYTLDLDKTISRKELLSGKVINIQYPRTESEVAMYTVASNGALKLRLDKATQTLILENVEAKMNFDSPLGDSGTESIRFAGIAKRVL